MFEYHASVFMVGAWRYTCEIKRSNKLAVCTLNVCIVCMA
jgi:hypothetical protein